MNRERWQRVERLFEEAGRLNPAERSAFLDDETSGDAKMRREVQTLLDAIPDAEAYLDRLREDLLGSEVQEMLRRVPEGTDAPDPWIGQTISHYEIVDRIGGGGMGVVYRARDLSLDRLVAIKFIAPEIRRSAEARERFMQEARAASALDHPNICTIHEIAETDEGRLYLVMAAYEGDTLRARLGDGAMREEDALGVAEQVARALAAAHGAGIVHRDVKPANILLTEDGVAKLLDFGLAQSGKASAGSGGGVEGTVAYLSPEQVNGGPADARSDVWALGVTLFEMLAGERPFAADGPREALERIRSAGPVDPPRADLHPGTNAILRRTLAPRPEDRYADGGELLAALQAHREATGPGGTSRLGAIALGAAILAVAIGGLAFLRDIEPRGPVRPASVDGVLTHVLWVDDNPINNEELIARLARRDVEVTTALATGEGVARYDPSLHQLVVSDIGRYEGEGDVYVERAGIDLLVRLKAFDPAVKVAFCTSTRALDRYGDEAMAAGAIGIYDDCEAIFR